MKETLLEHHDEPRIESLRYDPGDDCSKCLLTVEPLAKEHGCKNMCDRECIDNRMQNIWTA